MIASAAGAEAAPHDLRHYFASVQIRGGQSIKVLQALLGHKSAVETRDTYGHLMGDEDGRSRALIDAALGGRMLVTASAAIDDCNRPQWTSVAQEMSVVEPQWPLLILFLQVRPPGADGLACRPGLDHA